MRTASDILSQTYDSEVLTCPFCQDTDFDLEGLVIHIDRGDCEVYEAIRNQRSEMLAKARLKKDL
jgi:hypothetical protein